MSQANAVACPKGHKAYKLANGQTVYLPVPKAGVYYRIKNPVLGAWYGPAKDENDALSKFAESRLGVASKENIEQVKANSRIGKHDYGKAKDPVLPLASE